MWIENNSNVDEVGVRDGSEEAVSVGCVLVRVYQRERLKYN